MYGHSGELNIMSNPVVIKHHKDSVNTPDYKKHQSENSIKYWENFDNRRNMSKKLSGENSYLYNKKGAEHPTSKSVVQLSFGGEFIQEYSCISEAVINGFRPSNITNCCRGRQKYHKGYIWMYSKDYYNSKED